MACFEEKQELNRTFTQGSLGEIQELLEGGGYLFHHLDQPDVLAAVLARPDAVVAMEAAAETLSESMYDPLPWYGHIFEMALQLRPVRRDVLSYLLLEHPAVLDFVRPAYLYGAAEGEAFWSLLPWRDELAARVTGQTMRHILHVVDQVAGGTAAVLPPDLTRYILRAV